MFDNLSDRLSETLGKVTGVGRLTEDNIQETLREVRMALLEADVALEVVKAFVARIKERAIGEEVMKSLSPGQAFVKIVHEELVVVMGEPFSGLNLSVKPPAVILMAGLQGAGKTTTVAKLAKWLKEEHKKKVMVTSADVYRPAAIKQLETLATEIKANFFPSDSGQKPIDIAKAAIAEGKTRFMDVVIIDTAGRLAIDEQMMTEIAAIRDAVKPNETLFVVDAMTGQDAVNTAKAFNDVLDFDGVVLTKLDGDTRGGAAISIKSVVDKPIKFIGTGEKMEAIDVFYPSRMADRILGMGDVVSLVERAQEQFDEEEARKIQKKIAKNRFGFDDFLSQIQQIKKMGNMKDLIGMIPGAGKALKGLDIDDDAFKHVEAIIHSMTPDERANPSKLNMSRKKRIAQGSGRTIQEVNQLLKQFNQMSKMMKMMQGGGGKKMMQMMQNMR